MTLGELIFSNLKGVLFPDIGHFFGNLKNLGITNILFLVAISPLMTN